MTERTTERPEGLTDEHLEYLDELRASGDTNMFGARPYIAQEFDLDDETARKYLIFWMRTFGERHESITPRAPRLSRGEGANDEV